MLAMWLTRFLPGASILFISGISLVELHSPDGRQVIYVNPEEVSSVREPQVGGHFAPGTKCLLFVTNGNFISVREDCLAVRKKLIAAHE